MSQISLVEAKNFLRVGHTAQDTSIQNIIDGAEAWVEETLGRRFTVTTRVEYLTGGGFALRPRQRPVVSVTEVYDDESSVAVNSDDYDLVRDGIYRDDMERWNEVPENAWRVTYVAGEVLPPGLKLGILMLIDRAYQNRSGLERQGAAGYGMNFQSIAQGDIMDMLRPWMRGGAMIG